MDITVIGLGYAGLVAASCFADLGHRVTCLDTDTDLVERLTVGDSPIFEPGLDDLLTSGLAAGRLRFVARYEDLSLADGSVVFLVVGTPGRSDGSFDLSALDSAIQALAPRLVDGVTIVVKSTVPVGEARRIQEAVRTARPELEVAVVSNPEFLSQGRAVEDFMEPDRIVVGADDPERADHVLTAYEALVDRGVRTVSTGLESAELVKYASNAFLATKLSFINEIADLCETAGARIDDVALGIGLDTRIGPSFLRAGPGFGGSCLPKDTAALRSTSRSHGTSSHIVHAALEVNRSRVARMSDRILAAASRDPATVCMLGVAFKAGTDDVRESPAVAIATELAARGSSVRVHDPHAMDRAAAVLGSVVEFAPDAYEAAAGADVVVIATDWPEFAGLDFPRIAELVAGPVVVDLRNLLDGDVLAAAGLRHLSIGRPDPA